MASSMYLAPGGSRLRKIRNEQLPEVPSGAIRVVCVSDTHNEHDGVVLPWGHILCHAGDVLTESGRRHVKHTASQEPSVSAEGHKLLQKFAVWLGKQPHPHKAVIGGNHDWVLAALGAKHVNSVLAEHANGSKPVYLEHESASLPGGLTIFGSPQGYWGSHNDAFLTRSPDYSTMPVPTHIMMTHMPPILPHKEGQREKKDITGQLQRCSSALHIGGHCHWAAGLYFSSHGCPCVVASVSDSHWERFRDLRPGPSGERGDAKDKTFGGYNLKFCPIVCDITPPGVTPPDPSSDWISQYTLQDRNEDRKDEQEECEPAPAEQLPKLLFFCPANDPGTLERLAPFLRSKFDVHVHEKAAEAVRAVAMHRFAGLLTKLGTSENKGSVVMQAFRGTQGNAPIVVHSATALSSAATQSSLRKHFDVNAFVDHSTEDRLTEMLPKLCKVM